MTRRRPSLADIARRAGVSTATVSRVLNEHPQVRAATLERVKRVLAELRYDPSALFEPFIETGSPMLGFLIPSSMLSLGLNRSVYLTELGAIRDEVEAQGYGLFVGTFTGDPASDAVGDRAIRDRQIRGAILARVRAENELRSLTEAGLPVVVLNRPLGGPGVHSVTVDNRAAARSAAEHLLMLGHRRLGVIGGPADVYSAEERLRGYEDAIRDAGLPAESLAVARTDLAEEQGKAALCALLDRPEPPTAILAVNDYLAIAAVEEAGRRGLRVPDDLSIVGFDDIDATRYVTPALTTVRMPWESMARLAARLLVANLRDPNVERVVAEMRTELVVRASTAPPSDAPYAGRDSTRAAERRPSAGREKAPARKRASGRRKSADEDAA